MSHLCNVQARPTDSSLEGRVAAIGPWTASSQWSLSFSSTHTEDGRPTPTPGLLSWAEDGKHCIGIPLGCENLILRKELMSERGRDMQTEGETSIGSRTHQVCVSATGPQFSLVKWDPSSLRTVVFHTNTPTSSGSHGSWTLCI